MIKWLGKVFSLGGSGEYDCIVIFMFDDLFNLLVYMRGIREKIKGEIISCFLGRLVFCIKVVDSFWNVCIDWVVWNCMSKLMWDSGVFRLVLICI